MLTSCSQVVLPVVSLPRGQFVDVMLESFPTKDGRKGNHGMPKMRFHSTPERR